VSLRHPWFCLLVVVLPFFTPSSASAQGGMMHPMCVTGCITYNVNVPNIAPRTWAPNTSGHTATFQVQNTGENPDEYELICSYTGPVTSCSTSLYDIVLDPGEKRSVTVTYSVGSPGSGSIILTANGVGDSDPGSGVVNVAGPPTIALASPGSGSSVTIHNRQPIIRAYFTPGIGDYVDTTKTVLTWGEDTVTALARHNRGLLEWEVDSAHWLTAGLAGHAHADTAALVLKICGNVGGCVSASRSVILSDATPILGFSGMPLGYANGGYGAPFGPGLSVQGADVSTGFSTRSRTTLGMARNVGLVYSTRTSYPRVLVPVDLDIPWPTSTPSSITVRLKDGGVVKDTIKLTSPNTSCLTGSVRRCRVTLQADYSASSQTVARKWLTVEATVVTDQARTSSDSVEAVIVDRRQSPYGSGWWPTMYTQLVQAGGDRILVSASGGVSIYRGNGDTLFIPPPGSFTSITYTGLHDLRSRGSNAYETFDINGRATYVVDASGNEDYIGYDGTSDRIRWRIDKAGQRDSLIYNGSGLLIGITEPQFGLDSVRDTVTINPTTHQLTRRRLVSPSARPDIVTYQYQAYPGTYTNVLTRRMGTIGDTTRVVYDSTFRRRPVQVVLPRVQDETGSWVTPALSYTAYERQGWGSLRSLDSVYVEMKDPLNHWTRSLLNRWAQPLKTWDALGLLGRSGYDPDGLALWSEGKNGDSSRVYTAYDKYRRVVKTWIERGATSGASVLRLDSLIYDGNHRVIQRIDARGQSTYYAYDGNGRPTMVRTPNGTGQDTVRTWYGTKGLVDSTKSSAVPGGATRFAYDTVTWNVVRVLSNTGDTLAIKNYDEWGRVISSVSRTQVGASGSTRYWQWTRDTTVFGTDNLVEWAATQLSGMTSNPAWNPSWMPLDTNTAQKASNIYDATGRLTGRVNNRGKQTSYSYDRLGRVVARRPWADSTAVRDSLVYDIAGNLKKVLTRRGVTITHYYDSRNRDTLTVIPGVGDVKHAYSGPQDQVTRVWLANAVDSIGGVNGEVRYGYDSRGRLRADTAYTGSTPRVTTYAYDTYERSSSTANPLGTWTVRYETVRGLADTLITPMADTVIAVIDAKGQLTSRTIRSNGARVSYVAAYKMNLGLLADTTRMLGGTPYISGSFSRATADTSVLALSPTWTEQLGAGGATHTLQDSTDYNSWGRLTHWTGMKNGVAQVVNAYGFDAMGNLLPNSETVTVDRATDRLTSRVNGGVTQRFQYDRAGNLVTDSTVGGVVWKYGYDNANRLVSARRNGTLIARYGYDVLGRRVVKRVYSSVTGGTVGYLRMVYSGNQVAFETDSAGTMGLRYTWGPGTDNLLAIHDYSGNHWYATTDRLGSVRSLATRDGTWLLTRRWDPYGNEMTRDSSASFTWGSRLRYGWTGREYDVELGMYYHRARYYAQTQRRFIQEDPVEGSTSPYAYVNGSPLEATDPSGMMTAYQGPAFHEFCTMGGTCINGYGVVSHPSENDGFELPSGGGGGMSMGIHIDLTAQLADGSEVPCSQIPEQCQRFLEDNPDLLMSRSDLQQQIDAAIASSPLAGVTPNLGSIVPNFYRVEVGGWCSAKGCSAKVTGTIYGTKLGKQPSDAILGWHSHPNSDMIVDPTLDPHTTAKCRAQAVSPCFYGPLPSQEDGVSLFKNNYTVPMYVVSPQRIVRYEPSGQAIKWTVVR
jgi:RHS repeat-associated protein